MSGWRPSSGSSSPVNHSTVPVVRALERTTSPVDPIARRVSRADLPSGGRSAAPPRTARRPAAPATGSPTIAATTAKTRGTLTFASHAQRRTYPASANVTPSPTSSGRYWPKRTSPVQRGTYVSKARAKNPIPAPTRTPDPTRPASPPRTRRPPSPARKSAPIALNGMSHQPNADVIRSPAHGLVTPAASGSLGGAGSGTVKSPVLRRKNVHVGSAPGGGPRVERLAGRGCPALESEAHDDADEQS